MCASVCGLCLSVSCARHFGVVVVVCGCAVALFIGYKMRRWRGIVCRDGLL